MRAGGACLHQPLKQAHGVGQVFPCNPPPKPPPPPSNTDTNHRPYIPDTVQNRETNHARARARPGRGGGALFGGGACCPRLAGGPELVRRQGEAQRPRRVEPICSRASRQNKMQGVESETTEIMQDEESTRKLLLRNF